MRYLTMNELRDMLGGRGRTTIYRDIEAGRLPPPIKLGGLNYFSEQLVEDVLCGLVDLKASPLRKTKGDRREK
ncbi:helix-turn-helix transcriptional regulator [Pseudorhodobacter aquimaris]|uniref:helix-turn-helix transcriptional regulator n=1 Tax=Pseudorhodobacter aquimaris TaxID=687412 RepID=UPI0009FB85D1|nr:hypothetical protein [Pseudorhodobacter aquimaris]